MNLEKVPPFLKMGFGQVGGFSAKGALRVPRRDVPSCDRGYMSFSVRYTFGV